MDNAEDKEKLHLKIAASKEGWEHKDLEEFKRIFEGKCKLEINENSLVRLADLTIPWIIFTIVGTIFLREITKDLYDRFKEFLKSKFTEHVENKDVEFSTLEFHFDIKGTKFEFRLDYSGKPSKYGVTHNDIDKLRVAIDKIPEPLEMADEIIKENETLKNYKLSFNDEKGEWEI